MEHAARLPDHATRISPDHDYDDQIHSKRPRVSFQYQGYLRCSLLLPALLCDGRRNLAATFEAELVKVAGDISHQPHITGSAGSL